MKIAIIHCRKSGSVCTGAACFRAYNNDLKSFAQYKGDRPELAAFLDCGGCECDLGSDAGMAEKLERLVSEGVTKVHVGICIRDCPKKAQILAMLARYGLEYEEGTH